VAVKKAAGQLARAGGRALKKAAVQQIKKAPQTLAKAALEKGAEKLMEARSRHARKQTGGFTSFGTMRFDDHVGTTGEIFPRYVHDRSKRRRR
jgi:hypothetical protein